MKLNLSQSMLAFASVAVLAVAGNTEPSGKAFRLFYHSDTQAYYQPCG